MSTADVISSRNEAAEIYGRNNAIQGTHIIAGVVSFVLAAFYFIACNTFGNIGASIIFNNRAAGSLGGLCGFIFACATVVPVAKGIKSFLIAPKDRTVSGFGGWLAVFSIRWLAGLLYFFPLRIYESISLISNEETWLTLTSQESDQFIPYFAAYAYYYLATSVIFFLIHIWLTSLALKKSKDFPKLCVAYTAGIFVMGVANIFILSLMGPNSFDDLMTASFVKMSIPVICIAYLLLSTRVKNTFIN